MVNYEKNTFLTFEKYERIVLPYQINDLERVVSSQTMYYHYNILHKNYEVRLLKTLRGSESEEKSEIEKQFSTLVKLMENLDRLPEEIREDVRFFGGGLINHNFFFAHLTKFKTQSKGYQFEKRIDFALLNLIREKFTNLEKLEEALVKSALQLQGSGWTWLVLNKKGELKVINTANQDGPWALHLRPLIGIDVWEHAYIIDYHNSFNSRKEYVEKLLTHLLNWEYISKIYLNHTVADHPISSVK